MQACEPIDRWTDAYCEGELNRRDDFEACTGPKSYFYATKSLKSLRAM